MFVKGQSGNPHGRPTTGEVAKLRIAMQKFEKDRGVDFYYHFCEMAWADSTVMIALMKKSLPDLKQVDLEADLRGEFGVIQLPVKAEQGKPAETPAGE